MTLAGKKISIAYDPMRPEKVTVSHEGICPFEASALVIRENCGPKPALPDHMLPETPESSRFLEALSTKHTKEKQALADAISFGSYRKDGGSHV